MKPTIYLVILGLFWAFSSTQVISNELPPIPKLDQEIQRYMAKNKGSGPSAGDLETMASAAKSLAEAMPKPGLKIGEKAPDFQLPNPYGDIVNLYDHLQRGPVVLTFYRGAWCPFCSLQLRALQTSLPHIQKQGASLIAITPQQPDRSRQQLQKTPLNFAVLSDLNSAVIKAYRLHFVVPEKLRTLYKDKFGLDIEAFNGPGRYALPVPGTFVIDQTGTIRAAFANTDYKKRMEPAAILTVLEQIQKNKAVVTD